MSCTREIELSLKLRSFCVPHGKTKWKENNPKESAKILHQLGLLYKEKAFAEGSDTIDGKIKLIQAAALLNGALVRQPAEHKKIEEDLRLLCSDIIVFAKGKLKKFDLVKFAKQMKKNIQNWRDDVKDDVKLLLCIPEEITKNDLEKEEITKIDAVETIQNKITEQYKSFMKQVSAKSIDVLGDPPCSFTLVGMGSMARNEITPYSDFENVILLQEGVQDRKNYEAMLEYFRWYAVIFQVTLINFGETILPSVSISALNDDYIAKRSNETDNEMTETTNSDSFQKDWFFDVVTKRGISFDGMMPHACKSPLGRLPTKSKPWRIELIKPVSEMAQFLEIEQDLVNGYHLADILANTCFVDGCMNVYEAFKNVVESVLMDSHNNTKREVIKMIKDDMENHSTKLGISSTIDRDCFNVKQFAYRSTTIFITAIAKIHNIKLSSCFDIVRKMQERNLISDIFSQKLQYAVAIACEIRLKTYLQKGRQDDYVESSITDSEEDISSNLIQAVGKKSCYDYFEIACCLQYDAIAIYNLKKSYLYFHPVTMCIAISAFLHLHKHIISLWHFVENHPILEDHPAVDILNDDYDDNNNEFYDLSNDEFAEACNDICGVIYDGICGGDNDDTIEAVAEIDKECGDNDGCQQLKDHFDNNEVKSDGDSNKNKNSRNNAAVWCGSCDNEARKYDTGISCDKKAELMVDDISGCTTSSNDGNEDDKTVGEDGVEIDEDVTCNTDADVRSYEIVVKNKDKRNFSSFECNELNDKSENVNDQLPEIVCEDYGKQVKGTPDRKKQTNSSDAIVHNEVCRDDDKDYADNLDCRKTLEMLCDCDLKSSFHCASICSNARHDKTENHLFDHKGYCDQILGSWYDRMQDFNYKVNANKQSDYSDGYSSFCLHDKTISSLIDFGKYFYRKGVYHEALDYFRMAWKMVKKNNEHTCDCNQYLYEYWIGKCYFGLKDYQDAVSSFQSALESLSLQPDSSNSSENQCLDCDCFKEIAQCQQKMSQNSDACESYKKAIKGYKKFGNKKFDEARFCFKKLGICLFNMCKFSEAQDTFQNWLGYLTESNVFSEEKIDFLRADGNFHLGRSLLKQKEGKKSAQCFHTALELCQNKATKLHKVEMLAAKCWFLKGVSEWGIDEKENAFKSFSESLQMWESFHLQFDEDLQYIERMGSCHERIALLYHHQNLVEKAIDHNMQSLDSYSMLRGSSVSLKIVQLNRRLGKLHTGLKNYNEAYVYYNIALSTNLSLTSDSSNNILTATLYKANGDCLKNLGKFDDAKIYFEKSLQTNLHHLKSEKVINLNLLKEIGFRYLDLKDYDAAKQYFEKYIKEYYEKSDCLSSSEKVMFAFTLKRIGLGWKNEKKWDTALEYFQRSLENFESLSQNPQCDTEILNLLNMIGLDFLLHDDIDKAKDYFVKAQLLSESLPQTPKVLTQLAISLENLGNCYKKQMFCEDAIPFYEKARLKYLLKLPYCNKHNFKIVTLLKTVGFCFKFQGMNFESNVYFIRCLDFLAKLPKDILKYTDERAFILKNIGLNYLELSKFEKAITFFTKSKNVYDTIEPDSEKKFNAITIICEKIALCFKEKNDISKAVWHLKIALRIYQTHLDKEKYHDRVETVTKNLYGLTRWNRN